MAKRKVPMPKGAGFVCPPLVAGPDPVAKGVAAAVMNARLRGPMEGDFPAADALLARPEGGCKWPIGDTRSADFTFCGVKKDAAHPYCKPHMRLAKSREPLKRLRAS